MATPAGTLRVGPYFLSLAAIIALLYGIVFFPGQQHSPKLGLDLKGGAQLVLKAKTESGGTPSKSAMSQARQIMEKRVNSGGVSGATVVVQGSDQISIQVPGIDLDRLKDVGRAAQLNFRAVIAPPVSLTPAAPVVTGAPVPSSTTTPTPTATPTPTPAATTSGAKASGAPTSPSVSPNNAAQRPVAAAPTTTPAPRSTEPKTTAPKTTAPAATPTPTGSTAAPARSVDPLTPLGFAIPTSDTAFQALDAAKQTQITTAMANYDCVEGAKRKDDPAKVLLACDNSGLVYLLTPVIVKGTDVSSSAAVPPSTGGGGLSIWTVRLTLKSGGQDKWASYTGAHHSTSPAGDIQSVTTCGGGGGVPCAEYVAFTLDGQIISVPHNEATINGQDTSISGSFTESSATALANQLKYGALPLSFDPQTSGDVSATLGSSQLRAGMLAGGIGLALVVLYSLLYYRGLGLVTVASLIVSGVLTYASLVILGREIGFTLTLAGIAGFIVAVGITADSFVVFFERLKDEVHEGRSMRVAVPRAWVRARRTILSADTVSFLAAAVLYYFTSGEVRGFAFTLGLSTVIDLVVVFLFTHPIVSLLSRSKRFGSPRFTGLSSVRGSTPLIPDDAPRGGGTADERARTRRGLPAAETPAAAAPAAGAVDVLDEPAIEEIGEPARAVPTTKTARKPPGRGADRPKTAAPLLRKPSPAPAADTDTDTDTGTRSDAAADTSTGTVPATPAAPTGGTAAERAAARRARLRDSSTGDTPDTPKGKR